MSTIFAYSPIPRNKMTKRKTDHSLLVPGKYQKSLSTLGKKWEFGKGHIIKGTVFFYFQGKVYGLLTNSFGKIFVFFYLHFFGKKKNRVFFFSWKSLTSTQSRLKKKLNIKSVKRLCSRQFLRNTWGSIPQNFPFSHFWYFAAVFFFQKLFFF